MVNQTGRKGRWTTGRTYDFAQVIEWTIVISDLENGSKLVIFRDRSRQIAGMVQVDLVSSVYDMEDMTDREIGQSIMMSYDAGRYTYVAMCDLRFDGYVGF